MKFSIGDTVRLKRTGDEGKLTAFLSKQMYEVEVDGTKFPVHADEVEHPYFHRFTQARKALKLREGPSMQPGIPTREKTPARRPALGVLLSFLPEYTGETEEHVVRQLRIFLYNELPQEVRFNYSAVRASGESLFSLQGSIAAFQHLYLHNLSIDIAGAAPRYRWLLSGMSAGDKPQPVTTEGTILIKPAALAKKLTGLVENGQPTFSELLLEDFIPSAAPLANAALLLEDMRRQAAMAVNTRTWTSGGRFPEVLDLHAEALGLDQNKLTVSFLLEQQLATLRSWLDAALMQRAERLVVIHGVGTGRLRDEVHTILRTDPSVARFLNAWSGKYGFGATEIWVKSA